MFDQTALAMAAGISRQQLAEILAGRQAMRTSEM
jgi:hypothetical protein